MRAIAVRPGDRRVELIDRDEPGAPAGNEVLLRILEVGVCGTDREIAAFEYGTPPQSDDLLRGRSGGIKNLIAVGA